MLFTEIRIVNLSPVGRLFNFGLSVFVFSGATEAGIGTRTISSSYWTGFYSNQRGQTRCIWVILSDGIQHLLDSCKYLILQCHA